MAETVWIILLGIIVSISVLLLVFLPLWQDIPRNQCIIQQWGYLHDLNDSAEEARLKNAVYPGFKFEVTYCIDCIWYDRNNNQLMIKVSKEKNPVPYKISIPFKGIGCDCSSCDESQVINEQTVYCANLRKDRTYTFKISKDAIECLDCPESTNPC